MAIYVTISSTVGLTSDPLYALQPTGSLAAFSAAGAPLPVTSSAFRSAAFFLLGCLRVAIVAVYIFVPGTVCSLYVLTYLLLLRFNPAFCSLPRSCVLFFMNSLLVSSLNILRTALLLRCFSSLAAFFSYLPHSLLRIIIFINFPLIKSSHTLHTFLASC